MRRSLFAGLCLSAAALTPCDVGAQESPLLPRVGIFGTHALQADGLGTDFGVSLGVGKRLGRSGRLGIEVGYLRLGSLDEVRPFLTPPPDLQPATLSTNASRRLVYLGLNLERPLGSRGLRPVILAGLGGYGFQQNYSVVGRDSASGNVFLRSKEHGWNWGPGASLGLGLALPGRLGPFRPRVEARAHLSAAKTEESWTTLETLTFGVTLGW